MRLVILVMLSLLLYMNTFAQDIPTDRLPVASGRFYSGNKETLLKDLEKLFSTCKKSTGSAKVRAIISPHAGYIFSGRIAASAFSTINRNEVYTNIFIIASSHVMSFEGASVYSTGDYITPSGRVNINREIADKLKKEHPVFNFPSTSHINEHSIEVQLPFIQYYFNNRPLIVPVIIGTGNIQTIAKIANALKPYFTSDNLFIISSDFSHYPSYDDAIESDRFIASALESGDPKFFLNSIKKNEGKQMAGLATGMCGWTSGLTLMYLTEGVPDLTIKLIDYCNSGDSDYGDKNEVVGYNALAVFGKQKSDCNKNTDSDLISFTEEEKKVLFDLARKSILSEFNKRRYVADENKLTTVLKVPMGAFVTLKAGGELRGCIGRFTSSSPLFEVVQASALSSAFDDPRFEPVTKDEFNNLTMEITVLGPLKKISSTSEIILGRHGIYIKRGSSSGTMLPQVAIENNWTVEQFLGYTSRDKAGLGWDGWKEAELFIYEGIVLEERK